MLVLQGCTSLVLPFQAGQAQSPASQAIQVPPIHGRVDFGPVDARSVFAGIGQVAKRATVSLIDPATNGTVSTTRTNELGEFDLLFSGGFIPAADTAYVLEGVKGLSDNKPGNDVARVRTFIQFDAGTWTSVVSGTIFLDLSTSALALIQGFMSANGKTGPTVVALNHIGLIAQPSGNSSVPDTLRAGQTVVDQALFNQVHGYVFAALDKDQDPFAVINYTPGTNTFNYNANAKAPTLSYVSPESGSADTEVYIFGTNFTASGVVTFNGAPAPIAEFSPTRLKVKVPSDATTGPLLIQTADGTASFNFTVVPTFGGKFKGP